MSFAFWNKLAGQLAAPRPAGTEGVSPELAAQEAKRRREFFAPAFARLVELIRGRVKCVCDTAMYLHRTVYIVVNSHLRCCSAPL